METLKDLSLVNGALFPAPPCSYGGGELHDDLIYLPTSDDFSHYVCMAFRPFQREDSTAKEGSILNVPVVLYAHGNGEDIGLCWDSLVHAGQRWGVHIAAIEYHGYGLATGSPSEQGCNKALKAALEYFTETLKIPYKNIVLFGRSIGTGPSCFAMSQVHGKEERIGALVLQSPYLSVKSLAKSLVGFVGNLMLNRFNNEEAIKSSCYCPLLIIHGKSDELIPWQHAQELSNLAPTTDKRIVLPENSTHNFFDNENDILRPIRNFLAEFVFPRYDHSIHPNAPQKYNERLNPAENRQGSRGFFKMLGALSMASVEASAGAVQSTFVRVDRVDGEVNDKERREGRDGREEREEEKEEEK